MIDDARRARGIGHANGLGPARRDARDRCHRRGDEHADHAAAGSLHPDGEPREQLVHRSEPPIAVAVSAAIDRATCPARHVVAEPLGERDAERVLVGASIGDVTAALFGRHVRGRAGDRPPAHERGEPEVADDDAAARLDEHVVGFEVEVDEALAVHVREPAPGRHERLDDRAWPARRGGEPLAQRAAADVLHADVRLISEPADVEHRRHVRMRQLRHRARFGEQPARLGEIRPYELERDAPIERGVVGFVDHAHPADPDQPAHDVAADPVARRGERGGLERVETAAQVGDQLAAARARVEVGVEPVNRRRVDRAGDERRDRVVTCAWIPGRRRPAEWRICDVALHGSLRFLWPPEHLLERDVGEAVDHPQHAVELGRRHHERAAHAVSRRRHDSVRACLSWRAAVARCT